MLGRVEDRLQKRGSGRQKNDCNYNQDEHCFPPSVPLADESARHANNKGSRALCLFLRRIV